MLIQLIEKSRFTATTRISSSKHKGILQGCDGIWTCEVMEDEKEARIILLIAEFLRFFCDAPQPMTQIAQDEYKNIFLLTEVLHTTTISSQIAEGALIAQWLNLDQPVESSISNMINAYKYYVKNDASMQKYLHQTFLKVLLIPPAALDSFINACIPQCSRKAVLGELQYRQEVLQIALQETKKLDFASFLNSEDSKTGADKCLEALNQFKIHGITPLMDDFPINDRASFHELQEIVVHAAITMPNELYELANVDNFLFERISETSPIRTIQTISPPNDTLYDDSLLSQSVEMLIADEEIFENINTLSNAETTTLSTESPLSVALRATPSPISYVMQRYNPSRFFMTEAFKVLRGSPVPIMPINEMSL